MTPRSPAPRGAALALALALLAGSALLGGCKDRACIQWSAAEGACPSRSEAIGFMPPPQCGEDEIIESVDSEGTFDEDVCCYDVTFMEDPETVPCRGF